MNSLCDRCPCRCATATLTVAQVVTDELKSSRQHAADFEANLRSKHDLRLQAEKNASAPNAEIQTKRKLRERMPKEVEVENILT